MSENVYLTSYEKRKIENGENVRVDVNGETVWLIT
jgi:hypothetical protein